MSIIRGVAVGAAAGAAGTTALNLVTYLDIAVRARGASSTPQDTARALMDKVGLTVPGDEDERSNRLAGLGPLTGLVAGIGVGAAFGVARSLGWEPRLGVGTLAAGIAAMVASDGPIAALGVSDPRTWTTADWVSDAIPHLVYGLVTAAVNGALAD